MKVSVVLVYHGEGAYFIEDCLQSLNEQTFRDFELILVCNENTACDAISSYPDLDVKIVTLPTNLTGSARNEGIKAASGEYVLFYDADDFLETNALELLVEQTPADIVFGNLSFTWYGRKFFDDSKAEDTEKDEDEGDSEDPDKAPEDIDSDEEPDYEKLARAENRRHMMRILTYKKKNFQNITVLGALFRIGFIREIGLSFDDTKYYTDHPFLFRAVCESGDTRFIDDKIYIKRKHNDPINSPSLLQTTDYSKFTEAAAAYIQCADILSDKISQTMAEDENGVMRSEWTPYLNLYTRKYMRYVNATILPVIDRNTKGGTLPIDPDSQSYFDVTKTAVDHIYADTNTYQKQTKYLRKLIENIASGDIHKVLKIKRNRNRKNYLGKVLHTRAMFRYLYRTRYANQPMIDNMIVYESFFGKSYSDSPRYIFEYLNKHFPGKYQHVWINAGQKLNLPYPAKQVKRFSLAYFKYMARAKYHVFNGRQPSYFIKREGNVFLETWHGTPLKKLVFDMDDVTSATPLYKKIFFKQKNCWDYLIAPNEFCDECFKRAFMYDGNMLKTGYPRNDILYLPDKEREEKVQEIKHEIGLPLDKKVILYAPTWRDDEYFGKGQYKFTLQLELDKLKQKLGDEYIVILRMHYFIAENLDISEYAGFAYDVSKYDDIARLYLISDILITDYSSVFFDYANLRRPMLFFTYDLEKYEGVLRGFYIDVKKELPGPMLFTTDEIIDRIEHIEEVNTEYKEKYDAFHKKFCGWEDGHASEKVVNEVFK